MNAREQADKSNVECVTFPGENELAVFNSEKKTTHGFEFEKVFDPSKVQEEVFAEVSDLIVSVLDGFNVCIFAVRQHNTHTHTYRVMRLM